MTEYLLSHSFPLLSAIDYPNLEFDRPWLHLLIMIGLVLFNGFFVATEVALVKLRTGQLEDVEEEYDPEQVEITRKVLDRLDRYIPACKFGASIAGVSLGAISVPFLVKTVLPWVRTFNFQSTAINQFTAFVIAMGVVLAFLVVWGKVIPNSIGFRRELHISMRFSRLLHWFFVVFSLPIIGLTALSNWFITSVLRIEPASEREIEHSAEDLRFYVEESGEEAVTETEKEILINALELNDLNVRDIITPRSEVVALDINESFEDNLERAVGSKHTRFPVINEHLDETLGLVHIKDMIQIMRDDDPSLKQVKRNILQVNEELELDTLLKTFLDQKAHIALVKDEYGGSLGIVMLDDLLELLVGDIQDEFEVEEESPIEKISDDEYLVAANMPLHELDDVVPELDLDSPDVSTVGGYVTSVMGHLPKVGETTEIEGFLVKVTDADERKINQLHFERILSQQATKEIATDEVKRTAISRKSVATG